MPEVILGRVVMAVAALAAFASETRADVSAQNAQKAATLFSEGIAILDTNDPGQLDAACAKFEASLALDPQIGTRLNLGECRQRQGRYVEAYRLFQASAEEAARTGKPGRETFARQRIDALGDKLVRVSLQIKGDSPDLEITVAGERIPRQRRSASITTAPGHIVIRASAPDRASIRIERDATAGDRLAVEVPALEPLTAEERRARLLPWIVGGAGATLVVTSLIVGLDARSRYNSGKADSDLDKVDTAQREADIATALFCVGAVATGVGVWLYLRNREDRERIVIVPTATPTTAGITLFHAF